MRTRLLLLIVFFTMFSNKVSTAEQLWVGQTYQCFMMDYANSSLTQMNVSWTVDYGLYTNYSGTYVRTVSFDEYKSGTYDVKVTWIETDMSDYDAPIYHKSHTWSFTCKDNPLILSPTSASLTVGETKQLSCDFTYNNSYTKAITYSSSNTSVATVSSSGLVTAKAVGTATITAKSASSRDSKSCTITVTPSDIKVTSISLNKTSLSLETGQSETLTPTISPANATNQTVTWSSSNTSIATVDNDGKVTAKAKGSATITCIANDGSGVQATCSVTVTDPIIEPTAITISPSSKTIKVGETFYASYTLTPSNATTTVTWSSDNTSIATVTQNGLVKGISAGYTWINVKTANGKTDYFKVTVIIEPTAITISPSSKTIDVGESFYASYTLTPSNATTTVTWSSDNESIATVTQDGLVKGISAGYTYINVMTANGKTDYFKVTVNDPIIEPTAITISPSSKTIDVGETFYASYTLTPSNATTTVTWSSNNENVATVTQEGLVKGISAGSTRIKVTTTNGKTSSFEIIVKGDPVYPDSISVRETLYMKASDTYKISYSYYYPSGSSYYDRVRPTVTWSSNNTSVVSLIDSMLTAKDTGTAVITVKSANNLSASCSVTVIQPELLQWDVKRVSTGKSYTMILKTDGALWACGRNDYGQLGDGTDTDRSTPVQVMTEVSAVSAGDFHSMILRTDGSLWACGWNWYDQLGEGTSSYLYITSPVKVMNDVSDVSAGYVHTMIVKTDGTLWACGDNEDGMLGDGTQINRSTPVQVMTEVSAVSAGGFHTMILRTDGSLWACGNNRYGQLGDGTSDNRSTPVQVMTGVSAVSSGLYHTMILKTDGTLWACGYNRDGQLGDGTTDNRSTPVQVMTGVSAVSARDDHTMILKTDNTLWACGDYFFGQLGDGTTTDRSTPVQVMTDVQSVSTRYDHTMILKTDGSLWACGNNYHGQLCDGTNIDRHTPVQIAESDTSSNEKGDVNEDGYVNGTDLVALTNIILGKNPEKPSADVNGDGYVNGTDYVALTNIILGNAASRRMTDTGQTAGNAMLHTEPFGIGAGETKELAINLWNPDDALTLLQFDLQLPKGLTIAKTGDDYQADMAGRTSWSRHQLSVYGKDNHARFLLASASNDLIEGTEGAVIRLSVTADSDFNGGMIAIHDILGVTPDEQEVNIPDCQYSLGSGASGIYDIDGNQNAPEIYSLSGQRRNTMKKGINIVEGKKVIKK